MNRAAEILVIVLLVILSPANGNCRQSPFPYNFHNAHDLDPGSVVEIDDPPNDSIHKGRLTGVILTTSVLYVGSIAGLYQMWYRDYPQSSFHFIDDNKEWMLMDKLGHVTTSYWIGRIGYQALRWSGVDRKKSIWLGGSLGFVYLTTVEILDGFSTEWGASSGDLIANAAGAALFIGQQLGWDEQRILLKFSYSPTDLARYRPDLLGNTSLQRVLKDYNGQTYWLSANIHSFLHKESRFPDWLNVAFGYGADGMLGANSNPDMHEGVPLPYYDRYSQYYLTMDSDLTKKKTRSETLKLILTMIGFIKIPFPTIEFNKHDKARFHWIYF